MVSADQLRHEIDQEKGGTKVAFEDPSAAPLGTDDEAGGHPPTQHQIHLARQSEITMPSAPGPNASDESTRSSSGEGLGLPARGITPIIFAALGLFLICGGL